MKIKINRTDLFHIGHFFITAIIIFIAWFFKADLSTDGLQNLLYFVFLIIFIIASSVSVFFLPVDKRTKKIHIAKIFAWSLLFYILFFQAS